MACGGEPTIKVLSQQNTLQEDNDVNDQKLDPIATLREGEEWRILVCGINSLNDSNERAHQMELLSGILGEQIPATNHLKSRFGFRKNGVNVTVHVGFHADCTVASNDVDLFLYFLQVKIDMLDIHYINEIIDITKKFEPSIWEHSVVILTGMDVIADEYTQRPGDAAKQFEVLLKSLANQIQEALEKVNVADATVLKSDLLIRPSGRQDKPDLPKPHEKWFSLLWHSCYVASKSESMSAILKIAQDRIKHKVKNRDFELSFCEQPILAYQGIAEKVKSAFQVHSNRVTDVAGVMTGALIGALADGILLDGISSITGYELGAAISPIRGRLGAGSFRIVLKSGEADLRTVQMLQNNQILANLPDVGSDLKVWARKQSTCNIFMTGVKGVGVSTAAAALSGVEGNRGTFTVRCGSNPIITLKFFDSKGFENNFGKLHSTAEHITRLLATKDLLFFCIPMTDIGADVHHSFHANALQELLQLDEEIFSKTVIVLTRADEIGAKYDNKSEITFKQFFENELLQWEEQLRALFMKRFQLSQAEAEQVPIVPVGRNDKPSFVFSENEQLHWRAEVFLKALSQTNISGLPALIKANRHFIETREGEYPPPLVERARKLLVDTQCSMFARKGRELFEELCGEAVGNVLGVSDNQDW